MAFPTPAEGPPLPPLPLSPGPQGFTGLLPRVDRFLEGLRLVAPGRLLATFSVEEEFTDNVSQTETNRRSDVRTVVAPGISFAITRPRSSLSLAYSLRFNQFALTDQGSSLDHSLAARATYQLSPRISLALDENLIRSSDIQQADALLVRTAGRREFFQNILAPGARYQFGAQSSTGIRFSNTVGISEGVGGENTVNVATWDTALVGPRMTGTVAYEFTDAESQESPTLIGHEARLGLSRNLTPRDTAELTGSFALRDQRGGSDFSIARGSMRYTRGLSPRTSATVSVGIDRFAALGGDSSITPSFSLAMTHQLPYGALQFSAERRDSESFQSVDNVGVIRATRAEGIFTYAPGLRLQASLRASFTRTEFLQQSALAAQGQEDNVWTVGAEVRYRLSAILDLVAGYTFLKRESSAAGNSLLENRIRLGISTRYGF